MSDEHLLAIVTAKDLATAGVKIPARCDPASRNADLLERYRSVPNHAMFLYTSEDALLDDYIRQHWAAMDGLTGNICDIHVSLMQLHGNEDAYSQLEDVKTLPGLEALNPTELPALHIWSKSASLRISLAPFQSESSLKELFRFIFSEIRKIGEPLTTSQANELRQQIQAARRGLSGRTVSPSACAGMGWPSEGSLERLTGIFLSYRRADSQEVLGRIYDRLITQFPTDRVFRDLDSLQIGKPFPQALDEAVAEASVALIIIGPTWASISDAEGIRRLDNPSDFVRLEVEKALSAGFPVVPVMVSNASMPKVGELPESLRPLVFRHGVSIRPDPDFHNDMDRLIGKLSALLDFENGAN